MNVASARRTVLAAGAIAALLSGCDTWLGSPDPDPLPGKRLSVLALERTVEPDPKLADLAVRLPRPFANPDWPQAGGYPNHAMHHLSAKGPLAVLWQADIGEGSGGDAQLVSAPVVAGGRVFAMDAASAVSAFDAGSGERRWRAALAPSGEDDGIGGGGVAFAGGRLFAATGYGQVVALDAATGKELWRTGVGAPVRAAPTVYRDRVFATTIANELVALDAAGGSVQWTHSGITETAALLGGAAPTADGSVVLAAYSSGEIVALRIENGREIWSDSLAALRRSDPVSTIAHIRGRPVIDRGRVIVTANSGRTVAIDLRTGARLWERPMGSAYGPWVAGDFVYVLSSSDELVCLSRETGGVRWVTRLRKYRDPETREGRIFWAGLLLAGDRLLVGNSEGEMLSVSPYSGAPLGRIELSDKLFVPPVVAGDTLYYVTDDGRLVARR